MIKAPFWQVDSFTTKPFKGNPAAVFILSDQISDELMQNIATEMNLSETAYIVLRKNGNPLLRWFTPAFEIDLCGHATLAAAHIYLNECHPELDQITFDTKVAGPLRVARNKEHYMMDMPARPGKKIDLEDIPTSILTALNVDEQPIEVYQARDLMLIYKNDKTIYTMQPDFHVLRNYKKIIVTAKSSDKHYDFISRFFCSEIGINEDPVTGSAHCTSGPYWAKAFQKNHLIAYQASNRGGELILDIEKDRVNITGSAVTIFNGESRILVELISVKQEKSLSWIKKY
ncbi:MAG: PhzF family phenazine biosynthesis protein [Pseudomonadota bacterium]